MSFTSCHLVYGPPVAGELKYAAGMSWDKWLRVSLGLIKPGAAHPLVGRLKKGGTVPALLELDVTGRDNIERELSYNGACDWLWLANPETLPLSGAMALDFVNSGWQSSSWSLQEPWSHPCAISSGGLFKRDFAEAGAETTRLRLGEDGKRMDRRPVIACLAPLHFEVRAKGRGPSPSSDDEAIPMELFDSPPSGPGFDALFAHLLNPGKLLDVVLDLPFERAFQLHYYRVAAQEVSMRPLEHRSAVQRLVFGAETRADPLWFFLLDELGGEFRLRNFAWGDEAAWSWHPPAELRPFSLWLAKVACTRTGLKFENASTRTAMVRLVQPSRFKEVRFVHAGVNEGVEWQQAPWWTWLAETDTCRTLGGWVQTFCQVAAKVAASIGEERARALEQEVRAAHVSVEENISPLRLLVHIVNRHLRPKSPIRVELPSLPGAIEPASADGVLWEEFVTQWGLLDLFSTPIWPELDWASGLFSFHAPDSASEYSAWPALTPEWHTRFYEALYQQSLTFKIDEWVYQPLSLLGDPLSQLGKTGSCKFYLGDRKINERIEPFALR